LLRHPHFHLHFTPTYASWLNLVDRFFGMLTEKALRRGSHTSVAALREAILAYVAAHNDKGKPFSWTRRQTTSSTKCAGLACALNKCMLGDRTFVSNHRSRGLPRDPTPRGAWQRRAARVARAA
jgi:hypothetical protein